MLFIFILVLAGEAFFRRFVLLRLLERTKLETSLQFAIGRITRYILLAIGFVLALQIGMGMDLSSLAILAGAAGLGIGFGLQNIIQNFVSGIIILAERPIAIGDRIEVANVTGQVVRISLRSTTVVTNDNIAVIVPNSDFISRSVINWSHHDPNIRIRIPVGVAYGSDVEKVRRVLIEAGAEHPKSLPHPPPTVYFLGFGDSSLNFELAVWTAEMTFAPRKFKSDLYFSVHRKLRENQIEIPFPQRDLHLRSGSFSLET
jgi:small-conductance mechanosensitive channel